MSRMSPLPRLFRHEDWEPWAPDDEPPLIPGEPCQRKFYMQRPYDRPCECGHVWPIHDHKGCGMCQVRAFLDRHEAPADAVDSPGDDAVSTVTGM